MCILVKVQRLGQQFWEVILIYSDMLKGNKLHFYRMSSSNVLKAGTEGQFGGKENKKKMPSYWCAFVVAIGRGKQNEKLNCSCLTRPKII